MSFGVRACLVCSAVAWSAASFGADSDTSVGGDDDEAGEMVHVELSDPGPQPVKTSEDLIGEWSGVGRDGTTLVLLRCKGESVHCSVAVSESSASAILASAFVLERLSVRDGRLDAVSSNPDLGLHAGLMRLPYSGWGDGTLSFPSALGGTRSVDVFFFFRSEPTSPRNSRIQTVKNVSWVTKMHRLYRAAKEKH